MDSTSTNTKTTIGCQGACSLIGDCKGQIAHVEVFDNARSWGKFNYCQTAIEIDTKHGFRIEPVE